MKKPIAVKIRNEEEYKLAVEALDLAGFKWFFYPNEKSLAVKKQDEQEFYICVNPADYRLDYGRNACVYQVKGSRDVPDYSHMLDLTEFVDFFSTMTEENVQEFIDSYSTEAEEEINVPEDTEERYNTYLEIVTMPDRISITNISQGMKELIKKHWEIDSTVKTETFDFVAEINASDFLDFCEEFIIVDLDKEDLLFITACSLALLQVENKSMSSIRVSI